MELVDVVDSKSTAGDSVPVRVRSPAPKGKTSAFSRCLSFWVPPPEGRLHPSAFKCSGSAEPPHLRAKCRRLAAVALRNAPAGAVRNSRPVAGNLRATRRTAQKGRGAILPQGSRQSKISILTVPSKTKDMTFCHVFRFGVRGPKARSTLRDFYDIRREHRRRCSRLVRYPCFALACPCRSSHPAASRGPSSLSANACISGSRIWVRASRHPLWRGCGRA